jgi:hypothetical protein
MGWWWRESKKSNKPSNPPGMYENSTKTAGYPTLIDLKIVVNADFYLKVLNKLYSRDVL